jgi:hypothetical protein
VIFIQRKNIFILKSRTLFFLQVLELARNETKTSNNTLAKEAFFLKLNDSNMYYQTQPIPEIESNATAHERCPADPKKFCPVRWEIIQKWIKDAYKVSDIVSISLNTYSKYLICAHNCNTYIQALKVSYMCT